MGQAVSVANHYAEGDRLTYRAPERIAFNSKSVDYDNNSTDDYASVDNDIIFLGADADGDGTIEPLATRLQDGQKVTYVASDPERSIGGLVSGHSYYVIKLNDFQIRLADTRGGVAIPLSADKSGEGAAVRHLLMPQALGGLEDGVTYTVFNRTPSSFQLKDGAGNLVALSLSEATGTHFLSKEGGVDLAATGDSPTAGHSLRLDLVGPTSAVTNKLLGPNLESLRTFNVAAQGGPSSASARGGTFGVVGVNVPTAHATFAAQVRATSAAALLGIEGDLSITSRSAGSVTVFADTMGGGFVGVGAASAAVDYGNANTALLGTRGALDRRPDHWPGRLRGQQSEGGDPGVRPAARRPDRGRGQPRRGHQCQRRGAGGTIPTSGSITGNLTIGGPLGGQVVSVGDISGNVTIKGPMQGGRIATAGSVLGNVSIGGSIDSQSAITAGGSIGSTSLKTTFSSGDIQGIVAARGSINVGKVGKTAQALYNKANSPDAAAIDAIFQGLTPLSPTDLFDAATPLDLENLSRILVNMRLLKVQNGRLVIPPH